MKQYVMFFFILTIVLPCQTLAIDSFGKIVRQRPEKIDTSPVVLSTTGVIVASYSLQHATIPMNEIHSWQLTLSDKNGKALDSMEVIFSSMMPEHLHGMTTKPRISNTGIAGKYLLEGMNFHMPGWWEITLEISGNGIKEFAHFNLLVGEAVIR